ncbi:MAG: baseplate J/gp47 family protein [Anaerolineae bacterium]|nr:baseplate J/gp47 family protein [Anaerolineae bacterium]
MGPVQVILLTRHDTVDTACQLLRSATSGAQVWMVIPWRNRIAGTLFDLKRLRHVAAAAALDLRIVSGRLRTRTLAREAGIRTRVRLPWRLLKYRRHRAPAKLGAGGRLVATREQVKRRARGEPASLTFGAALLTLLLVVLLAATMLATAAALVPSATIQLEPLAEPVEARFDLTASPAYAGIQYAQAIVPARIIDLVIEGRGETPTTGTIWVKEKHASGNIVLVNRTDSPVLVPKGTIVRTGSGVNLRFYTVADVELPGQVYAHRRIGIIALEPGEEGNVDALTISVVEGENAHLVDAINDTPTSGGEDVTKYVVKRVDFETLREDLKKKLENDAYDQLMDSLEEEEFVPRESIRGEIVSEDFHQVLDEQTDVLSMDMQVRVTAVAVDGKAIEELAKRFLESGSDRELQVVPSSLSIQRSEDVEVSGNEVRLSVVARGAVAETIDVERIRRAVRGKELDQASAWLSQQYDLNRQPELEVTPDLWERMPLLPARIEVKILAGV